jgi:hypothetical protein
MTRGTCKEVRRGRSPPTAGRTVTGAHLLRTRGGGARSRRPPGSRRNPPRPRSPRRRPLQLPPTPSGPPRHQIRGRREGSGVGVEGGTTRGERRRRSASQAAGVRPCPARTASRFCSAPTCTSPVSHPRAPPQLQPIPPADANSRAHQGCAHSHATCEESCSSNFIYYATPTN